MLEKTLDSRYVATSYCAPVDASDLDDLAPVIGYRATRILQALFPARRLHVPVRYSAGHPLELLIGASALAAMIREFPGDRFWIPSYGDDDRYRRDWRIAQRFAGGASAADIASEENVSVKRAQQIRVGLVERGWLRYAQGFDTAMLRASRRVRDDAPPEIFGTNEVFDEPPGG